MKRWEYRQVDTLDNRGSLPELGREGWEAYGVTGSLVYLRRPLFLCARPGCNHPIASHRPAITCAGNVTGRDECTAMSCYCRAFLLDETEW